MFSSAMAFLKDDSYPEVPKKVNLKKAAYMDIAGRFYSCRHRTCTCSVRFPILIKLKLVCASSFVLDPRKKT